MKNAIATNSITVSGRVLTLPSRRKIIDTSEIWLLGLASLIRPTNSSLCKPPTSGSRSFQMLLQGRRFHPPSLLISKMANFWMRYALNTLLVSLPPTILSLRTVCKNQVLLTIRLEPLVVSSRRSWVRGWSMPSRSMEVHKHPGSKRSKTWRRREDASISTWLTPRRSWLRRWWTQA